MSITTATAAPLEAHPLLALAPFVAVLALFALNDWLRGRRGVPEVKVWPALVYGLRFVATAWRRVPGPLTLCVTLAVVRAWTTATADDPSVQLGLLIPTLVVEAFAYGACIRLAFQDQRSPDLVRLGRWGFQVGAVERRIAYLYLAAMAATIGLLIVLGLIVAAVVAIANALGGQSARDISAIVAVGVCAVLLLYALLRFYTVTVAVALNGTNGYGEAWRLGRAAVFSPLAATVVSILALLVLLIAAHIVAYAVRAGFHLTGDYPRKALVFAVSPFVLPFSAGLMIHFYRSLSEQQPRGA